MKQPIDLAESLRQAWTINHHVSVYLIQEIPAGLWSENLPGYPRKTFGMLASHLSNVRYSWMREIGKGNFTKHFSRLPPRDSTRREVIHALKQTHAAMLDLIEASLQNGGYLPARPAWLNFPNDILHFVNYLTAHEAHHRGQLLMAARQSGLALSVEVSGGLWQWKKRLKEASAGTKF